MAEVIKEALPDGKDVAQQAKNSFIKDAAKAMPVVEGVKGAEKVADNTPDTIDSQKIIKENSGKTGSGVQITDSVNKTEVKKIAEETKAKDVEKEIHRERNSGIVEEDSDVPTAFRQTEFASSYDERINQTPSLANKKVQFVGDRGESLCVLKPPPDPDLERLLNEAGVDGVLYKNAVPDFSPFSKAEVEIDHMVGGNGANGNKARNLNFQQANSKLAEQLNESSELAQVFGMEAGNIKASDIEKYRVKNDLTWHELNDGRTLQLVPTKINSSFGHLGGVGEINAGIYKK